MDDTEEKRIEFITAFEKAAPAVEELCKGHEDKIGIAYYVLGVMEVTFMNDELALMMLKACIDNGLFDPI